MNGHIPPALSQLDEAPHLVKIEVDTLAQLEKALALTPHAVLLDEFAGQL